MSRQTTVFEDSEVVFRRDPWLNLSHCTPLLVKNCMNFLIPAYPIQTCSSPNSKFWNHNCLIPACQIQTCNCPIQTCNYLNSEFWNRSYPTLGYRNQTLNSESCWKRTVEMAEMVVVD